jgi:nucleotide-binding universal stress UspA family protein
MHSGRETVLFAYDGSEFADEAVREASRVLEPCPALVLTVWQGIESIAFGPVGMSAALVQQTDSDLATGAEKTAAKGAEICRAAGFDAEPITEMYETAVWATIIAVARRQEVGLIVLGSHGRTGLDYVLKGSVATAVSQHAKRPVMIVPSAGAGQKKLD